MEAALTHPFAFLVVSLHRFSQQIHARSGLPNLATGVIGSFDLRISEDVLANLTRVVDYNRRNTCGALQSRLGLCH